MEVIEAIKNTNQDSIWFPWEEVLAVLPFFHVEYADQPSFAALDVPELEPSDDDIPF